MPEEDEETAPGFEHRHADALPVAEASGVRICLVAGDAYGLRSPVAVRSPLFYAHAELATDARLALPDEHGERALYVVSGEVECDGHRYGSGRMLVFAPGKPAIVRATAPSMLMLVGGESLGPRYIDWNFVSSRRERIEQAKADWRSGRFESVPGESEFIPLPD